MTDLNFKYIDSLDKITGNEIEQWASQLDRENKTYTDPKLAKVLIGCMMNEKAVETDEKVRELLDKDFLCSIISKRLSVLHSYTMTLAVIVTVANVCSSPGDVVMYLNYLQYKVNQNKVDKLNMEILCRDYFPMGFFSKKTLEDYWNAQKVDLRSDNLLDYPQAGKSIGCKCD